MSISRDNYESFFIDFLEGTLSKVDQSKLFDFLACHPDLKEEFALINNPIFNEELVRVQKLPDFNFLKKSCDDWVADEELIALMEHDLDGDSIEIVQKKMANYPANYKRYELFLKTKLVPEEHIFPYKISLKKNETKLIPLSVGWAVAASLLMFALIGIWSPWNQNVEPLAVVFDSPSSVNKLKMPQRENTQKGSKANVKMPVFVYKNSQDFQLLRLEENTQIIAPLTIKNLPITAAELFEPNFEPVGLLMARMTESSDKSDKFLTPGDFVFQQIKKEINKRYIGFSFHDEVDPEAQVIRYGFISKYFAYERIIQTN